MRVLLRQMIGFALGFALLNILLGISNLHRSSRGNHTCGGINCDIPAAEAERSSSSSSGSIHRRRLEFVHVTKTGGSTIERAALSVGVRWGACHFYDEDICDTPFASSDTPRNTTVKGKDGGESPWHLPPWVFEGLAKYFKGNPYEGADLFIVTRNPYSRVISEYYCPWVGKRSDDVKVLNHWVEEMLRKVNPEGLHRKLEGLRDGAGGDGSFILHTKHLIPQVEYVFESDGKTRLVPEENTLHFENLAVEFPKLLARYSMDRWVQLPAKKVNVGKNKTLTHRDLYPATVKLINDFFRRDFEEFGYTMVDSFDEEGGTPYSFESNGV
eukprot:CAMPEP_0196225710 /NCGR_PEP_ID=MMETSP0912-20130531/50023_1 /TAXON_ID=49265 /ORGANISM="Thalassiosira rotula, Strain GSO102" /LENGTH=326 /DNA_ID=CAMNT_0041505183 /DNA_START=76 /DNA_END=1056 /DNA_ORIENTATION=-